MSEVFADRLAGAIEAKRAPICVGIDPIFEMLPDAVAGPAGERNANDATAAVDAIFEFTTSVLRIVAPHVPCVKFQSAYFEKYLWEGVEAYYSLIHEAKELGLLVIGDVKRGDIGSTAEAYAAGHLVDPPFDDGEDVVDARTRSPSTRCSGWTRSSRSSTPRRRRARGCSSSSARATPAPPRLQDVKLADGRTWSEMLADLLRPVAAQEGLVGIERLQLDRRRRRRDAAADDARACASGCRSRSSSCPATAPRARRPT